MVTYLLPTKLFIQREICFIIKTMFAFLSSIGEYFVFLCKCLVSGLYLLRRPRLLWSQCIYLGLEALPLVSVAALSVGVVAWLQARSLLSDYDLTAQLPGVVAVFVIIGLGPVLTALVVAGQSGARLGAELGSMKNTEQIDALISMGISPIKYLITARVWACIITLPLLTIALYYLALFASLMAETMAGSISTQQYLNGLTDYLTLTNTIPAFLSSLMFGLFIGVTSCWFGIRSGYATSDVGRASTYSVIASMFLVLGINAIWVQTVKVLL